MGQRVNSHGRGSKSKKCIGIKVVFGYDKLLSEVLTQPGNYFDSFTRVDEGRSTLEMGQKKQEAFEKSKKRLKSAELLIHYDNSKELILACDALPYGDGAVLSRKLEDGSERPIAYASRTLTAPERNYAKLDKEGLAIVFGVKKFHQYLYGRHFTIHTDYKPLIGLFNEHKPIPQMASGRVQRWALTLATFEYSIVHKAGKAHANADALSRLLML